MGLKKYLWEHDTVRVNVAVANWEEAVRAGTDLLVETGAVEPRYYDAIVESCRTLGPYFLGAPGLAMPHARPTDGVLANGFSLVTLEHAVSFGDSENDPVDILITMAATDAKTQNERAIVEIVELFDDADAVRRLRAARTLDDIKALLSEEREG
ncbi:MAG: PTS sugar transporter subunit IIA [Spirochaetales bacterium]|nr:PTS sugar transporter subunit IIA [Spirochaetales bacterium]